MYYTESGDDTNESGTTVESTHLGIYSSVTSKKKRQNRDINIFGLSPFCVFVTHIDISICLKFQSNPLDRKMLFENVTKKCDKIL